MGDKRKRISWFAQGAISTVLLSSYIHHFGDEAFSETPEEKQVEREIGVPLFLNETVDRAQRTALVHRFAETYREAQENWDFFDEQFSRVRYLVLKEPGEEGSDWYEPLFRGLRFICSRSSTSCITDSDFIHELAHAWYFSISPSGQPNFRERWNAISGGQYQCSIFERASAELLDGLFGSCTSPWNCPEARHELAAVSCYATRDIWEDVAETIKFVYILNNPQFILPHFPNRQPDFLEAPEGELTHLAMKPYRDIIPRLQQKIELLAEYGAFSIRERDYALQQLDAYERGEQEE